MSSVASRYRPLADHLAALPPDVAAVTLPLSAIEALIGGPLPASARTSNWWTNSPTQHAARLWLAVGWRVTGREMRRLPATVTFARIDAASTPSSHAPYRPPAPLAGRGWLRRGS